jgi:hypothetical protein
MYFYCYDYVFLLYIYVLTTLNESLPCFFVSCKANARVNPQRLGTARTFPNFCVVVCIFCVVLCIFVLFYVLFVFCRSVYCFVCVYVYCTTATGWLPNCS